MFREELDLAILDSKDVLLQIDACLVSFQHIQAEQEVNVPALSDRKSVTHTRDIAIEKMYLHNGKRAGQMKIRQLELCAVHSSEDFGGTYSASNSGKSLVY
jgi:hypothetical protein